jgi:glutamyl-tRNA reductase
VKEIAEVMRARGNRPLFLIDIAVPRDIEADVHQLNNVFLYNVDHLETLVRENVRSREHELIRCREIIAEQAAALLAKVAPRTGAPVSAHAPFAVETPAGVQTHQLAHA